jgi:hypothetical protein
VGQAIGDMLPAIPFDRDRPLGNATMDYSE